MIRLVVLQGRAAIGAIATCAGSATTTRAADKVPFTRGILRRRRCGRLLLLALHRSKVNRLVSVRSALLLLLMECSIVYVCCTTYRTSTGCISSTTFTIVWTDIVEHI